MVTTPAMLRTDDDLSNQSNAPAFEAIYLNVDQLAVGVQLQYPIYDDDGLLLLAEGSVIAAEFKQHLQARGDCKVKVHADDAVVLFAEAVNSHESGKPKRIRADDDNLAGKFSQVVESGALLISNPGEPFKAQMRQYGCELYDPQLNERLLDKERSSREFLREIMLESLYRMPSGERVIEYVNDAMELLTIDADNLLAAAFEVCCEDELEDHCRKMSLLGMAVGCELGMNEENVRKIGIAGLLHDWGMLQVPKQIRSAKRRLTEMEQREIRKHPAYSMERIKEMADIPGIVPLVCFQVHERPNGSGYPCGRKGNSIHVFARILSVVDAYSAMTAPRTYRAALMPYAAMECLLRQAADYTVDPLMVSALLRVLSLFPIGSHLLLSNGGLARVLRRQGSKYAIPIVQLLRDCSGNEILPGDNSALVDLSCSDLQVQQPISAPGCNEIMLSPAVLTHGSSKVLRVLTNQTVIDRKQHRTAMRILDRLAQSDIETGDRFADDRAHKRKPFRTLLTITIPPSGSTVHASPAGENGDSSDSSHPVWAREISQGGMSFIYRGQLLAREVFVNLNRTDREPFPVRARIVRFRPVGEGFWEYGVMFQGRAKV